jgi:PPM family protein phosphatase
LRIEYGAQSDQGLVRTSNEDSFAADSQSKTFLVADGMGGHAAGEVASRIAAETVCEFLSGGSPDSNREQLLRRAVLEANTRVYTTQKNEPKYHGMGSTLTVLTFLNNRYFLAQVGDSRAYLFRDNTLRQLSRDHSLVWPLYEDGLITKDDISRHPQKNLITRSIGTFPDVEADLQSDFLFEGDVFLLCSDGLTDVLLDKAISKILSNAGMNPQEICDRLIQAANAGGGPDNITVVAVHICPGN